MVFTFVNFILFNAASVGILLAGTLFHSYQTVIYFSLLSVSNSFFTPISQQFIFHAYRTVIYFSLLSVIYFSLLSVSNLIIEVQSTSILTKAEQHIH